MDKFERAEMFSKIFDELDIDNQIDDDFDVVIEANNFRVFFIIPTEEDDYYSFVWPRLFSPSSYKEHARALHACNMVNARIKVCKAFISNGHVRLAAELYIIEPEALKRLAGRLIQTLSAAAIIFAQNMQETSQST